jgi:membrane protein DedA with SNARE-associated domain
VLDWLGDWVVAVMSALGGPGAALVVAVENVFPPIPSELVLPLAGYSASRGVFSLAEALFWTTLGSVVGSLIVYAVGARLGRDRARTLVARLPVVRISDVDAAEAWFAKRGLAAVFLGRMVPLVRCAVSLPAGVERLHLGWYILLTTAGSLIWNGLFVTAGYLLGSEWSLVEGYVGIVQYAVLGAVLLAIAWFVAHRLSRRPLRDLLLPRRDRRPGLARRRAAQQRRREHGPGNRPRTQHDDRRDRPPRSAHLDGGQLVGQQRRAQPEPEPVQREHLPDAL